MHRMRYALLACLCLLPFTLSAQDDENVKSYTAQTIAEFQTVFDDLAKQGWRPTKFRGYAKSGVSRLDVTWEKKPGPLWITHADLDAPGYAKRRAELKAEGYQEIKKSQWKLNDEKRFWILWEKPNPPQ